MPNIAGELRFAVTVHSLLGSRPESGWKWGFGATQPETHPRTPLRPAFSRHLVGIMPRESVLCQYILTPAGPAFNAEHAENAEGGGGNSKPQTANDNDQGEIPRLRPEGVQRQTGTRDDNLLTHGEARSTRFARSGRRRANYLLQNR